jgi:hypothetical protein
MTRKLKINWSVNCVETTECHLDKQAGFRYNSENVWWPSLRRRSRILAPSGSCGGDASNNVAWGFSAFLIERGGGGGQIEADLTEGSKSC